MRSRTAMAIALALATPLPLAAMFGSQAAAQQEVAAPEDEAGATAEATDPAPEGLEEIVVHGRKREELIQDTPISMVALSSFDLENRTIERIDEIGKSIANLKFDATSGSNSAARIYIRGVGQDRDSSLVDPGVGLYVDGVYLPRTSGGLVSVIDLEQVEVLRGPQGTLYGKNTAGGIINLLSKKPEPEFGGKGTVRWGNYGTLETRWALNVPLNFGPFRERVFTRFALATATNDGWVRNVGQGVPSSGEKTGDNKLLGGRFALRALPADDMIFDFTADWSKEHETGRLTHCVPANPINSVRFVLDNFTDFPEDCEASVRLPEDEAFAQDLSESEPDVWGVNGTFEWQLGDTQTLKTINAWRRRESRSRGGDLDGTMSTVINSGRSYSQHDHWQHELQYNSSFLENRLSFVGGVFWFKEKGHGRGKPRPSHLHPESPLDFYPGEDPEELAQIHERVLFTDAVLQGALIDSLEALSNFSFTRFETVSYAGYGNLQYQVTEDLLLEAGLRRTQERKLRQGRRINFWSRLETNGSTQTKRFDSWTPMARATYHFTEDFMAYFSYARGWKSGGFNNTFVDPTISDADENMDGILDDDENMNGIADAVERAELEEYDEEIVDSFEIGIKTAWFDNRLTANLSAFYYDYDEIQLNIIEAEEGFVSVNIRNAAQAVVQGFELEVRAIPFSGLVLSGGLGHTNADYDDFPINAPLPVETFCSNLRNAGLTGRDVTGVPGARNQLNFRNGFAAVPVSDARSLFNEAPGDCPLPEILRLSDPETLMARGKSGLFNTAARATDFSDRDFKHTPAWNFNLSATYSFDVADYGRLSLTASWYHRAQMWFNVSNTPGLDQGKFGELDGRISFDLADGDTTLAVWGKNLLDRTRRDGVVNLGEAAGGDGLWWGWPRTYGIELTQRF